VTARLRGWMPCLLPKHQQQQYLLGNDISVLQSKGQLVNNNDKNNSHCKKLALKSRFFCHQSN